MKKRKKRSNLLFIFIIAVIYNLNAQDIEYIESEIPGAGKRIVNIQFRDTVNYSIIKTVDLKEQNPFYNMFSGYDSITGYRWEDMLWFNNKLKLNDLIPKEKREHYLIDVDTFNVRCIEILPVCVYKPGNKCIVYCNIILFGKQIMLGTMSQLYIYDNNGNILLDRLDYSLINSIAATNDCKYIGITHGADFEGGQLFLPYFEILDVKNNKITYKCSNENSFFSAFTLSNGMICFDIETYNKDKMIRESEHFVFDQDRKMIFKKAFEIETDYNTNVRFEVKDDGYYYYDNTTNKEIKKVLFENDFEKINIQK